MTSAPKKKIPYLSSRLLLLAMIGMALAMYACYPGGATNVEDFDLVVTLFDESFDYKAQQTYRMPNKVVELDGTPMDTTSTINPVTEQLILQTVADNMTALGYTRILLPDTTTVPDVVVVCSASTQDWAAWVSYPWWDYWGWWPGWGYNPGYPGWGGGGWGWGYPPSGSVYQYTVGTLLIDMSKGTSDPDDEAMMQQSGVWGAGLSGLLSNSLSGDQERVVEGINQAFEQSPYLDTN